MKSIKSYLSIYQYLQDVYNFRKSQNKGFSYATWSQQLGIRNKAYLRLMVIGRRPLNEHITTKLIEHLNLQSDQAEYFQVLTAYSQCKNLAEKELLGRRLVSLVRQDFNQEPLNVTAEFLSHPLLPKLHSLLSFKDIPKDCATLAMHLNTSPEEIHEGLVKLKQFDLIKEVPGNLETTAPNFKVADKFKDRGLEAFYKNLLGEAAKAISLPVETRRFRSLFFAMNESDISELNRRLDEFAKEILARHDFSELQNRRLYQFHYNFFPLSEPSHPVPPAPF